ncbi:3-phenylpropionate/trans-cinnamate dioxygenase ferredoxin subunit [Pseudonocardia eucalypti]|uniref:Rieske 2Fe-2S domain-containing protein n=1 Tax=Pseudonocardia eucalypti TaxID=648755 RepID=UPI00160A3BB0|nr:3-phenylpropionate/trans-cinnamate dioxygenase ferredoxin subunit [Pseudonocardia eucalypti]
MNRCRVAGLEELKPGGLLRADAEGVPICLARLESGEVHAINDICSHEEVELSDGDLQGTEVECPAHGSRFSVLTGEADGFPAEESVATYPVTVDGDDIYVEV